jgi:hypothetical protein
MYKCSSLINPYFCRKYFASGIDEPPSPGYSHKEKDQQNTTRTQV